MPKGRPFGFRHKAKDGHLCGSDYEWWIDDWFTNHGVEHEREPKVQLGQGKHVRADWKVGDTYVEFFGIYFRTKQEEKDKIEAYRNAGLKLFVIRHTDWIEKKLFELIYQVAEGVKFVKK